MKAIQFGKPPRPARYKGVVTRSMQVPMSDGTKIAVDVMRPGDAHPAPSSRSS